MTEAARLVDELTTLLYEVIKRWQLPDGRVCEIVRCGACRRKADRAESVVHGSDCPVYRLIRAEEANTAVIRANADEIADLEDRRDELEGRVNALTAEMECRNELSREVARLQAQLAERDAEIARLVDAGDKMHEGGKALRTYVVRDKTKRLNGKAWGDNLEFGLEASTTLCEGMEAWRAALAARGGKGQG